MKKSEQVGFLEALQEVAARLCANMPDQLEVDISDDLIRFTYETWCPALTRRKFASSISVDAAAWHPGPFRARLNWDQVAMSLIREIFGWDVERHANRQASALALGLVHGGEYENLPPGHMAIDRTLLAMLDEAGVDVRGAAAELGGADDRQVKRFGLFSREVKRDGFSIRVIHEGVGPPVISTRHPLGRCIYDGETLGVPDLIPQTLAKGAIDLALGEIVDTGRPTLDRRRIVAIEFARSDDLTRWFFPEGIATAFVLEPDRVEVGAPWDPPR